MLLETQDINTNASQLLNADDTDDDVTTKVSSLEIKYVAIKPVDNDHYHV